MTSRCTDRRDFGKAAVAAPSTAMATSILRPAMTGPEQHVSRSDRGRPRGSESRLERLPALDGVRGLAVAAVLAFHGGLSFARGGFLGVDAFFVLSGYLITTLLLREWDSAGRIRLGAFWMRRARRLLPALLVVIAAVVIAGRAVLPPEEVALLRGDALATLGYVANWRMIDRGGRPSPAWCCSSRTSIHPGCTRSDGLHFTAAGVRRWIAPWLTPNLVAASE